MLQIKVLTGKIRERKITLARAKDAKSLNADGWLLMYVDPRLHPSETVESVDTFVSLVKNNKTEKAYLMSNCDHVFNRLRVLRSRGYIDSLEFIQYNLNPDGTVRRDSVTVDGHGRCSSFPTGFLEEWNSQTSILDQSSDEIDSIPADDLANIPF